MTFWYPNRIEHERLMPQYQSTGLLNHDLASTPIFKNSNNTIKKETLKILSK